MVDLQAGAAAVGDGGLMVRLLRQQLRRVRDRLVPGTGYVQLRTASPGDAPRGEDPHRTRVDGLRGGGLPAWRPRPGGLEARPSEAGLVIGSVCSL